MAYMLPQKGFAMPCLLKNIHYKWGLERSCSQHLFLQIALRSWENNLRRIGNS